MEYLHPSVSTRIIDNSIIFMAAQGLTNLYAVITADKGKDNVIQYITSPTEYLFEYGTPDIAKHGQAPMNLYQWINTSGGAYVLRVVPPDATYSNLVGQIHYRDEVTQTDGNFFVKTAVSHVVRNPALIEADNALDLDRGAVTQQMVLDYLNDPSLFLDANGQPLAGGPAATDRDGFRMKKVFALLPKARGAYYDNLGFRLTVTDAFDNTYDFRVYNFEVIEKFPSGGYNVVEGPFLVSLSPDAMSRNQESMYMPFVLGKYSLYFDAVVNDKALDLFAEAIDNVNQKVFPSVTTNVFDAVNPDKLDVVSGTFANVEDPYIFTPACRASIEFKPFLAGGSQTVNPGDKVTVILECSNSEVAEYFEAICQTGETLADVCNRMQVLIDNTVNFDCRPVISNANMLTIANADPRESFQVVDVIYQPANPIGDPQMRVVFTDARPIIQWLGPQSPELNTIVDPAEGPVYFITDSAKAYDIPIPVGTMVRTVNDQSYETVRYAVLPAGQVEVAVTVRSVAPGGNALAGKISILVDDIDGIDYVQNRVDFVADVDPPRFNVFTDFNDITFLKGGYDGTFYRQPNISKGRYTRDMLIARGFGAGGYIDPKVINKKEVVIDLVMDANYADNIKNAIVDFCRDIRGDCFAIIDTGFTASPAQALQWRRNNPFSTFYAGIFTQDFVILDNFTGMDAKVTSTYFLANKIPNIDEQFGIHWPFVGPRRGTISGFKKLSWNPTEPEKEMLYKRQINYVESDVKRTKFGSQLTSQTVVSALSNINAVRTLLRIKRDVEEMAEDYQFEFGDAQTYQAFQYNLNGYLQRWIANRACTQIKGQVYASAYDKQQKICRVRIDLTFNYVIERIFIDIVVNR